MKLKERESSNLLSYLKKGFAKLSRFMLNEKMRKMYLVIFAIILIVFGLILGLIFSGYFGTFDQPSGRAYTLLTTIGINSPHDLKVFTEGVLKENIKIPINYVKGQFSNPEKLFINIGFTNYEQIGFKRQEALELGVLISSGADFVPATIIHDGQSHNVRLRLKGDLPDHWKGDKWSLRIKVRGNDTLLGMKVFSIQDPATRQELNEMIYQETLKKEGVIGLRYRFVEVVINGENKGIYALEEHFSKELIENNSKREGIILKFDEDTAFENSAKRSSLSFDFAESFYGSPITTFENEEKILNDPLKLAQFKKAMGLLESLRDSSLEPHEIFDVDKIAKYYAVSTLMNCQHSKVWHNIRIYYNPVTSLLEPVGFDGNCRRDGGGEALKEYVPRCIELSDAKIECSSEPRDFSDLILSDGVIFERYIGELEKMSQKEYMDNLLSELDDKINEELSHIHKEKPFYSFSTDGYYNSQNQIRDMLNPLKGMNVYFDTSPSLNQEIILSLGNTNPLPIEILNFEYNETIFHLINSDKKILQPRNISKLPAYKQVRFKIPENFEWKDSYVFDSIINYKILGTNETLNVGVFAWPYIEENFSEIDFIRQDSNLSSFDMLEINENTKVIQIKKGVWKLNESLIIPPGFFVVSEKGTIIDLVNNAMILSYSPISLIGTEDNPIQIISSDRSGQGLTVLNPEKPSYFDNVIFKDLTNPSKGGWELFGAINLHDTKVTFNNVLFSNINSEDSLNLINSEFEIKNSIFKNCSSDCFDSDFGKGVIKQTSFENCGNDCIDFSGSFVEMEAVTMSDAGDKGLSAGERSNITIINMEINGGFIAIASKDQSNIFLERINISNTEFGFVVYQKKPEYGSASISAFDVNFMGVGKEYTVEKNSDLRIDGIIILDSKENVFEILYRGN